MQVFMVLAWRNLWRNYRRTLIMLGAIVVGVWAMIFMTALMRGMVNEMLVKGITNLTDHVQVHHADYRDDPSIDNRLDEPSGALLLRLQQDDIKAWTVRVRVPAVVASERESRGVTLVGIDPAAEVQLSFINDSLSEGRMLRDIADGGVVMGAEMVRQLDTRLGKRVVVMTQDPDNQIADRGVRIVGVYQTSLQHLEQRYLFMGRAALQSLLGIEGEVSEVAMQLQDPRQAERVQQALQQLLVEPLEANRWQQLDTYLATMLTVMDGFVLVWMVVVFLALSFGLVNTLVMALFERTREIGLMMALGVRPSMILMQVLLESLFLLLLGLVFGSLAAWITIEPLQGGIDISSVARGMEMMGAGSVLYPLLLFKDLVMANVVVLILGLLASVLPAWRAAHLQPLKALSSH